MKARTAPKFPPPVTADASWEIDYFPTVCQMTVNFKTAAIRAEFAAPGAPGAIVAHRSFFFKGLFNSQSLATIILLSCFPGSF